MLLILLQELFDGVLWIILEHALNLRLELILGGLHNNTVSLDLPLPLLPLLFLLLLIVLLDSLPLRPLLPLLLINRLRLHILQHPDLLPQLVPHTLHLLHDLLVVVDFRRPHEDHNFGLFLHDLQYLHDLDLHVVGGHVGGEFYSFHAVAF